MPDIRPNGRSLNGRTRGATARSTPRVCPAPGGAGSLVDARHIVAVDVDLVVDVPEVDVDQPAQQAARVAGRGRRGLGHGDGGGAVRSAATVVAVVGGGDGVGSGGRETGGQ